MTLQDMYKLYNDAPNEKPPKVVLMQDKALPPVVGQKMLKWYMGTVFEIVGYQFDGDDHKNPDKVTTIRLNAVDGHLPEVAVDESTAGLFADPSKHKMPMSEAEFVENHGMRCPACTSTDLDKSAAFKSLGDKADRCVRCCTCKSTWHETWVLEGYHALKKGGQ